MLKNNSLDFLVIMLYIAKKITVMKNYQIKMYWKGLKGEQAHIGEFLVSQNTLDKLENNFKGEISIEVWDDTKQALHSYAHIVNVMKETEYGKLAFKDNSKKIPFYQPHILASLKEATGVDWKVLNHKKVSKPQFIQTGATFEWWEFQHIANETGHGDIRIAGITCNGRFISSSIWNMYYAGTVTGPDYNGNSDFDKLGQYFKEKFPFK